MTAILSFFVRVFSTEQPALYVENSIYDTEFFPVVDTKNLENYLLHGLGEASLDLKRPVHP